MIPTNRPERPKVGSAPPPRTSGWAARRSTFEPPSHVGATFHAQQAAEKTVKGLLVAAARHVPKTHDLEHLSDQCVEHWPDLRAALDLCRPLTQWGTEFRYPRPDEIAEPVPPVDEIRRIVEGLERFLAAARAAVGRDHQSDRFRHPRPSVERQIAAAEGLPA